MLRVVQLASWVLIATTAGGCQHSQAVPVAVQSVAHASAPRTVEERLRVGMRPAFDQLQDIDGKPLQISASTRPTVLIFFATWCHDSQRLMHQLQRNSALLQQARFIAFGRGESIESLKKFRDEYQLPIHFVADPTQHYYQQVTNTGIPRVILLDAQHQVVKTFLGEIPDAMAEIVWP